MTAPSGTTWTIANNLIELYRNLFGVRSFVALKARMISLLVVSLLVKAGLDFKLEIARRLEETFVVIDFAGVDVGTVLVLAVLFGVLVICNLIAMYRRDRFNRLLVEFAGDDRVSESLRKDVIEKLTSEYVFRY